MSFSKSGMAVISFDFWSQTTCPSTRRFSDAQPRHDKTAAGEPFADDPGVFFFAFFRVVTTELNVSVLVVAERQRDDCLSRSLVKTVAGEFPISTTTHVRHTAPNSGQSRII